MGSVMVLMNFRFETGVLYRLKKLTFQAFYLHSYLVLPSVLLRLSLGKKTIPVINCKQMAVVRRE